MGSNGNAGRMIPLIAVAICAVAISASAVHVVTTEDDGTIFTLDRSSDGSLYFLKLKGDDHFGEYLEHGSADMTEFNGFLKDNVTCGRELTRLGPEYCSVFTIADSDGSGYLTGRNFDYYEAIPCVIFNSGKGIYSSVSTTDLAMFCDLGESYPELSKDTRINAATYVPMDGINENGVFICINAVNNGPSVDQNEEGRVPIFTTSVLRAVLNHAGSALEALDIIDRFNLRSGPDFHLFVCDNLGKGYAVDIVDGKSYVTQTALMTNHYLAEAGKDLPVTESSKHRFEVLESAMTQHPEMDKEQVRDALISVKQDDPDHIHFTRWSAVYDMEELTVTLYIRVGETIDYQHGYSFGVEKILV